MNLMKMFSIVWLTFLGVTQLSYAESSLVKREEAPAKLQERITALQKASQEKNIYPVIEAVAQEFTIERDFGGMFIQGANAVTNFLQAFQLDDSKLFEEYQGIGWKHLSDILEGQQLLKLSDQEYCTFGAVYHNDMVKDEKLCFKQGHFKRWFIVRIINAGD
ncbi:MAG: hypothetical protein HWE27_07405 [Gammaproteobacteria bacterium]|nr:hypothetical protein [Gammaproteobacteria bacterium]